MTKTEGGVIYDSCTCMFNPEVSDEERICMLSSNALFNINFKTKYFVETWNRLEFNPGNQPQNSLLFCRRAFKRNSINFRSFLFLGNISQKKMGLNSMNLLIHVILLGCTQVALNFKL